MTHRPIELDEHRGVAAQKSTELRRRLQAVQADQTALRQRQDEFERCALAAPSANWPEAAAKARYLIHLFAVTPEARDPRRQELIATVLDELARLSDQPGSIAAPIGASGSGSPAEGGDLLKSFDDTDLAGRPRGEQE